MRDRTPHMSRREALLMTAGASALLTPWGAMAANAAPIALTAAGEPGDGTTDATEWLVTTIYNDGKGGDIFIPAGDYRIAAGDKPNTGGAIVRLRATTRVFCHPKTRFIAGTGLDGDMVRVEVDSERNINFEWHGGTFDQTEQKISTSVPFDDEGQIYRPPAHKRGESPTTDGLSVSGRHGPDATARIGINRCVVMGVTTIGNSRPGLEHWQMAGGDSGIFVGSCRDAYIGNCRTIGNRDLGIYGSGGSHPGIIGRVVIEGNVHINCFHGSAIKRWVERSRISGNYAENCIRGFQFNTIDEIASLAKTVEVSGNLGHRCGVPIRMQRCTGFSVRDNHFTDLGAQIKDPELILEAEWLKGAWTVDSQAELTGIIAEGCTRGVVVSNTVIGLTPGAETVRADRRRLIDCVDNAGTKSSFITWMGNAGDGLRTAGRDTGNSNSFIENVVYNSKTPHMEKLGTNSYEVRLSDKNARIQGSPLLGSGTAAAPLIAHETQTDTGLHLAAKTVGVSVTGKDRIRANDLGVAFNGKVPKAPPTYAPPTGIALRNTFDTKSVNVKDLAGHVKAIIDDLRARGDFQ